MPNRTSLVASTLMSSDTRSYSSSSSHPTHSTALTTPDLSSPKKNGGRLEAMLEVFEGGRQVEPTTTSSRRGSDVSRGPSVRMRASQFEQQAEASSSRLPAMPPVNRTRSTSPLRIAKIGTGMPLTPSRPRRIPVPSTAPPRAGQLYAEQPGPSPPRTRSPPRLHRGTTRRMVQQWESLPTTPASNRVVSTNITRDYLDKKPLPSPGANPSPRSTPGYRFPNSPSRNPYLTSPSQHLQTPRHTSHSLTNSPSSWSLSPSGEKRRKGKSPLKEMLNVFGGGILRKGKGKVKEKWNRGFDSSVPEGLDRMGSSGLPGGIVFRDRMGDHEMQQPRESDPSVIRSSAIIYLIPTPCSSVSPWGSWLTSWATLTPTCLSVTYCPIFQDPQAGNQTPKRVFSGSNPSKSADPPFTFAAIPLPSPNASADVELSMADCVEVRSLRKEEVKGRGVPPLPHGPGTEVLEMVWQDGTKRYMGVEGVSGRLGWVSAIWDVLLACKTNGMQALPPPSPTASPRQSVQLGAAPLRVPSGPYRADLGLPNQEFAPRERAQSGSTLKASRGNSSAPPVQKIGDRWIAAGAIANSDVGSARQVDAGTALRTSVQRMFEAGPDAMETEDEHMEVLPAPDSSRLADRVNAWQPVSERELSIFSRNNSKRSAVPSKPTTFSEIDRVNGYPKSETTLSFDPNDLNPSRSASQVGRKNEPRNAPRNGLTVVDEASGVQMDAQTNFPAPTHISHVTFPKPTVGGVRILPAPPTQPSAQLNGGLETIPSAENSSVESSGETIRTPASTAASSLDHTILAKLQTQTTEHSTLSNQIDGVHVDLRQVILSLSSLVTKTRRTEDETYISPALDDKLSTIHMDVKAIENALNLSTLSTAKLDEAGRAAGLADSNLADVHAKLDAIASLCENVLSKSSVETSSGAITTEDAKDQVDGAAKAGVPQGSLGIVLDSDEEKTAGNEVAQIMAELTGGSSKNSPRLGGLQVLHNISNPSSPRNSAPPSPVISGPPLSDDTKQQVGEVLGLVKELKEARTLQTQQTTDIARYLNELNSWLEKFVLNSTNEIASMSKRLTAIVGTDPDATPADGEKTIGMPDLVADMHSMITEQNRRIEAEGTATQRLDALLGMMGQERERQASQMGMVDQVMGVLDRQRSDNEVLLRALATDLTAEIRGERLRFVEAMQQATTMNISSHVEEFKKLLSAEVGKAMKELGQLREERKALEHQISDLFALKAKHGGRDSRKASAAVPAQAPPSPAPTMLSPQGGQMLLPPMQGYGGRILPSPPAR